MPRARIPLSRARAAKMPPVCIICGGPVDAHVSRTFSWRPGSWAAAFWVSLLCPPTMLVILALAYLNTRSATVECPVCVRHRGYWTWRCYVTFAPLLAVTIVVLTVGILLVTRAVPEREDSFGRLVLGTVVAFVVWGAGAKALQRFSLRAVEITEDDITLTPVSAAFAELVHSSPRRERAEPDPGWEPYDPYPRLPAGNAKG